MEKIEFQLAESTLLDVESKRYNVLRVGDIHTGKYGKLTFTDDFFNQIINNFNNNALEVLPYVDVEHKRGESYGIVKQPDTENGVLSLGVDWNEQGRDAIEKKKYLYLSVDIGTAINSKTGEEIYPVLRGVALVNFPGYKDQKVLELSDSAATATTSAVGKNKGGFSMEKLIEMINGVLEAIANTPEAEKPAAMAKVAEMLKTAGIGETETGGKQMNDETIQMMDTLKCQIITLSDELKKQNDKNKQLSDSAKRKEFDSLYVGKKITPANADKFFQLMLSDEKLATEIITAMPDLTALDGEKGGNGQSITMTDFDRANMKESGYDPEKPEDIKKYMEAMK